MRLGHVFSQGGIAAMAVTRMTGDPLAFVQDLDGGRGQAHVQCLADQVVWDAVEALVDGDVVVDTSPLRSPIR